MIDPAVLRELMRIVEATRGYHHPVSALLRRAAETKSLRDYAQAWSALDRLTLGEHDPRVEDGDGGAAGRTVTGMPDAPHRHKGSPHAPLTQRPIRKST